MKDTTAIILFKLIPKSLLSRVFGVLMRIPLPLGAMKAIIRWYSVKYGVKDEYDTPPGGFRTFNAFFTRTLRPGVHRIAPDPDVVVSPVDARVDQFGTMTGNGLLQAKGLSYSVNELIPADLADSFCGGSFMTLYLSPGDYHRIHSPVPGSITGYIHSPGTLYTVQEYMVSALPGLFIKNERITTIIRTGKGLAAVCKVGALNVGRISLSYAPVMTNTSWRRARYVRFDESCCVPVSAGQEIGTFNLGSTVILVFQKDMIEWEPSVPGMRVRMGQKIARFIP